MAIAVNFITIATCYVDLVASMVPYMVMNAIQLYGYLRMLAREERNKLYIHIDMLWLAT